jgi:alpha-1,3-mannosyltransferase
MMGSGKTGVLFYALALTVKMSAALYLPAFMLTSVLQYGVIITAAYLGFIVFMSWLVAVPFIYYGPNAFGYWHRAYNIGRRYDHEW